MQEHLHTGLVPFLFAGISAIIFIQLVRLASAKLVEAGYEGVGSSIGALVNFS